MFVNYLKKDSPSKNLPHPPDTKVTNLNVRTPLQTKIEIWSAIKHRTAVTFQLSRAGGGGSPKS